MVFVIDFERLAKADLREGEACMYFEIEDTVVKILRVRHSSRDELSEVDL